jgi:5-formyltetrahydrofolate cyclo-ligase
VGESKREGHDGKISRMTNTSANERKAQLRKMMRAGRKSEFGCAEAHSLGLIEIVAKNGFSVISGYEEFDNEPSLAGLRHWCAQNGIEVLLPKMVNETELAWFGSRGPADFTTAELVIMPALAAGRDGSRLGRGKGYFDRALAGHRSPRVVVVHDSELFTSVPTEEFDQFASAVVTCSEVIYCDGRLN